MAETASSGRRKTIQCGTHGNVGPAFVCSHVLDKSKPLGFHEAPHDPDDPDPQGWCDVCENAVQRAGDWTDDLAEWAQFKLVCEFCFAGLRDFHARKSSAGKTP